MAGPLSEKEELELLELEEEEARARKKSFGAVTQPDVVSKGGPQTLGQMKIPGLQDYIVQNMQEQRDAEAQRKQLDQTATQAGFEARGQAAERMGVNSPLMQAAAAPALAMAQQEGGRQVFNEAGVMLPDEAAGTTILNAQGVGIPGFVSSEMRDKMRQAYEDQPGWALTGEIAGSIGPGEALFQGGKTAYNALAKPFVTRMLPKGGSSVARGTRLATHGAEQVGAWTGQNAVYQATTGASSRAAQEGRAPTLADVTEGAKAGATDPINMIGPAAGIALNRIFTAARSGGRTWTPKDRQDYVAGMVGKSPGSGSVLDAEMLGGDVDQRAEGILIKMLGSAGYSRDDISRSLAAFDQLANETTDLPTLTARLKDVFIEQLGPDAENVILDFLQGAGVSRGSQAGRSMQRASDEDYGRIGQFLEDSGNARLGSGSRWNTLKGAEEEMRRIGAEQYDPILNNAGPIPESIGPASSDLWQGPAPSEPQGLFSFIRNRGGIREQFGQNGGHYQGGVQQILGDVRKRPGLLNNKSGLTLDEMVTIAKEAGFDVADEEDLLRQLSDELTTGKKTYRIGEAEEWTAYQEFLRDIQRAEDTAGMIPEAHPLRRVLDFYAKSRFGGTLKEFSDAEMKRLDEWVKTNPRQAAHWMQSKANSKAQELRDAGRNSEATNWEKIRDNILAPLEESTPGYRETRLKFGDEFGTKRAVTFGSRFFTKVQDTIGVKQLAEDYAALTPDQQAMARMSIRDEYQRLIGRHRSGAAPRLTQVDTDSALAGLEEVLGPEGAALANDIRYGSERLKRTVAVDNRAGPRTASNQEARAFADRAVSNPISRTVGNALKAIGGDAANTSAFGAFAPIHTVRSLAGGIGERMARGRQGKMDDVTALLLRDVGANPRPAMPGDVPTGAPPTNAPQGIGRSASPAARPVNAFASNQSGFISPAGASTLAGVAGGGITGYEMAGDTPEEKLAGTAFGALAGLAGGGTLGKFLLERQRGGPPVRARLPKEANPFANPQVREAQKAARQAEVKFYEEWNQTFSPGTYPEPPEAVLRDDNFAYFFKRMKTPEGKTMLLQKLIENDPGSPYAQRAREFLRSAGVERQLTGNKGSGLTQRQIDAFEKTLPEPMRADPRINTVQNVEFSGRPTSPEAGNAEVIPFKPKPGPGNGIHADIMANQMKPRPPSFTNDPTMAMRNALAENAPPVPGRKPKIKSDVPLGTPPKTGNQKLGGGNLIRDQYESAKPPRLPEGPMTDAQIAQRRKVEAVQPLVEQGLSNEAIRQQTGVQTITYKGQTFILPDFMADTKSDTIAEFFWKAMKKPFDKRPKWVQNVIRATADSEETALAAQRKWDKNNPMPLGTKRTPMVKPGKNALSGE
jgi:hypothetical protein